MKQTEIDPRLHNLLFVFCLFGVAGTVGYIFASWWTGRTVPNETYLILGMFAMGLGLKFSPRQDGGGDSGGSNGKGDSDDS